MSGVCFSFVFVFFSAALMEPPFSAFFMFLGSFEGPRRDHCWTFFGKKRFFHENVAPSFSHTFKAFWLDFEGLGPPGGFNEKKQHLGNHVFFC